MVYLVMPFSREAKTEISNQQGHKPLHPDRPPPYHYIHIDHDKTDRAMYDNPDNGYLDSWEIHYEGHFMSAISAELNRDREAWAFHTRALALLAMGKDPEKVSELQQNVLCYLERMKELRNNNQDY